MNTSLTLGKLLAASAFVMLPLAQAATSSAADYKAGKAHAAAVYKLDKTACASHSGNANDICMEEAKAREKVSHAELEYAHTGTVADQNKLYTVRAETGYTVAKQRCDDENGNNKDVCVAKAKAVETKALAEVKLVSKITDAAIDSAKTTRDAEYNVATEKCEALAVDAKTACTKAAKSRYGKT